MLLQTDFISPLELAKLAFTTIGLHMDFIIPCLELPWLESLHMIVEVATCHLAFSHQAFNLAFSLAYCSFVSRITVVETVVGFGTLIFQIVTCIS